MTSCQKLSLVTKHLLQALLDYLTTNSSLSLKVAFLFFFVHLFCRVCGSYEAMGLGRISEALQDFTGGVIEMINLQNPPPDVYKVLHKAHERHSLMGASIEV